MAKLPVLMYHDVHPSESGGLTISVKNLEAQFKFLAENGYKSYHVSELLQLKEPISKKNMLLTFDDGYVSHLELVQPLLEKYNLKATFFVPLYYLGKTDEWNAKTLQIMDLEQLKSLNTKHIELGFHSYYHKKYNELSTEEIAEDTQKCFDYVEKHHLNFVPALAYPFGKYPRGSSEKERFFKQLKGFQFEYGLRIGNRVNTFPFKNPFEIQRIDVKGEFTISKFKRKLKWGKIF